MRGAFRKGRAFLLRQIRDPLDFLNPPIAEVAARLIDPAMIAPLIWR